MYTIYTTNDQPTTWLSTERTSRTVIAENSLQLYANTIKTVTNCNTATNSAYIGLNDGEGTLMVIGS